MQKKFKRSLWSAWSIQQKCLARVQLDFPERSSIAWMLSRAKFSAMGEDKSNIRKKNGGAARFIRIDISVISGSSVGPTEATWSKCSRGWRSVWKRWPEIFLDVLLLLLWFEMLNSSILPYPIFSAFRLAQGTAISHRGLPVIKRGVKRVQLASKEQLSNPRSRDGTV